MGTVYLAYDPRLGRNVAIKVLRSTLYLDDPEFSTRFEREARTVASLSHSSIVPIYEYGDDGEWRYLVMPYLSGGSLKDRLKKGPLPPDEAVKVVERIGSALDKSHNMGIYHRDVKPANILFNDEGEAFLSDFGIVKLAEDSKTFTRTGATLGTPHYMSPEQIDNENIDRPSDLYALGVIIYEMLTGQKPYDHDSIPRVLIMHLTNPVPDILEVAPSLPSQIADVIRKAMAKDPASRYQSGATMAKAIQIAIRNPEPRSSLQTPVTHTSPSTIDEQTTTFLGSLEILTTSGGAVAPDSVNLPEPTSTITGDTKLPSKESSWIIWLVAGSIVVVLIMTGNWWISGASEGDSLQLTMSAAPTPTVTTIPPTPTPEWPLEVTELPEGDPASAEQLYNVTYACASCHGDPTVEGSNAVGPWLGKIAVEGPDRIEGTSAAQYIYESILFPNAFIAPICANGPPCPEPSAMPYNFGERMSQQDLGDIIAYLMSFGN